MAPKLLKVSGWLMLAALSSLGSAQDLTKPVTYTAKAKMTSEVLSDLSQLGGFPIACHKVADGEPLIIDVRDVQIGELLKRIADVTGSEWVQENGGYTLTRPEAKRKEQYAQYLAERTAAMQKSIDNYLKNARQGPDQQLQQAMQRSGLAVNQRPSPANQLMAVALEAIGAKAMADIQPMSRAVFATSANKMQARLTLPRNVLNDFIAENNKLAQENQARQQEAAEQNIQYYSAGGVMYGGQGARPIQQIGKVIVSAQRFGTSDFVQVSLVVTDTEGNIVASTNASLNAPAETEKPGTVEGGAFKPIELSKEAKEFAALIQQSTADPGQVNRFMIRTADANGAVLTLDSSMEEKPAPSLSAEWRERILNPEKFDPLSFVPAELYIGSAKSKDLNLVANLPDSVLTVLARQAAGAAPTAPQILSATQSFDVEMSEADGWLVIKPKLIFKSRDHRQDREALGRLLRSIDEEGLLRLWTLAAYSMHKAYPYAGRPLDQLYTGLISPSARGELGRSSSIWRMLQLYHNFSAPQRQALFDGRPVNLSSLSPSERGLVSAMFYGELGGTLLAGLGGESIQIMSRGPGGPQARNSVFATERTEQLPDGIPSGGSIVLKVQTDEGVAAKRGDGSDRIFTAAEYGSYLGAIENPSLNMKSGPYEMFRLLTVTQLNFTFNLSQEVGMSRQLQDKEWATNKHVSFDNLPAKFKDTVAQVKEQAKKAFQNVRIDVAPPGTARDRRIPPRP